MRDKCSFCSEIDGELEENLFENMIKPYCGLKTRFIFETENWIVLPTIGSICPGYLLIIAKQHYTCIGECPKNIIYELDLLANAVRNIFQKVYKMSTIAFEHGAISHCSIGGGCIDHAHLHILPTSQDVLSQIQKNGFTVRLLKELSEVNNVYKEGKPYLFYQDSRRNNYILENSLIIPSQYIRKFVAKQYNKISQWDWRRFPEIQNICATMKDISTKDLVDEFDKMMKKSNLS